MCANLYELVNGTYSAKSNPIAQNNVTRKLGIVADGAIAPNDTIMTDMAVGQDPAIVSHGRFHPV
jgi:hypothetical protein